MEATIRGEKDPLANDLGVTTRRDNPMGEATETGNGRKLCAQLDSALAKANRFANGCRTRPPLPRRPPTKPSASTPTRPLRLPWA